MLFLDRQALHQLSSLSNAIAYACCRNRLKAYHEHAKHIWIRTETHKGSNGLLQILAKLSPAVGRGDGDHAWKFCGDASRRRICCIGNRHHQEKVANSD